ncbi:FAD-linked oxidoreductase [Hymenopellis radicata]|nr:FAD-linked oxidoreductase [Hymenopellis radicata]
MCQSETLVDNSPKLLSVLTSIPGVKQVTEALVRITFFNQFVGGDTAHETVPLLNGLRAMNIGALFAYSVEVDENEATAAQEQAAIRNGGLPTYKRSVGEMIRCIDIAADFEDGIVGNAPVGRRTWVAVKMTALLPDAKALVHLSQAIIDSRKKSPIPFPGSPQRTDLDVLYGPTPAKIMPPEDVEALRDLHGDLVQICRRAKERGVRVIIDAEYSWYQPAIDAFQNSLMREFNKLDGQGSVQPLIYGTYQAYLRRTPIDLVQSFAEAEAGGYALGVKLVRGAYHPHEIAAHRGRPTSISISPDELPPVWLKKEDTDRSYNECAKVLVGKIKEDIARAKGKGPQRLGVLFGTHNWTSSKSILKELVATGLGKSVGGGPESDLVVQLGDEVTERLTFGQLYGMSDALTDYLVKHTRSNAPMIIKYVPYGALSEVMPYLDDVP